MAFAYPLNIYYLKKCVSLFSITAYMEEQMAVKKIVAAGESIATAQSCKVQK